VSDSAADAARADGSEPQHAEVERDDGGMPAGGRRASRRSGKSADAFRTISEVSDELEVPQHVLRFWETKFSQVKPMKRGGGRRYYRPEDIELLRRIRDLLYHEGYTIKGVQKLLRESRSDSPGVAADAVVPAVSRGQLDPAVRRELEALRRELAETRARLRRALDGA
jgi:DNA-binding transcriptional MerR regulator